MKTEMIIRAVAGSIIIIGVLLSWFVAPYWLLLPAFVGINLCNRHSPTSAHLS